MVSAVSLSVFASWLVLCWLFAGLGTLLLWLAGRRVNGADDLFLAFWLGLFGLLLLLEVWQLFLPVNSASFALFTGLGLLGLCLIKKNCWRRLRAGSIRHWPALLLLIAFSLLLANLSLAGSQHGDTGSYFVQTAMWLRAYPIIPGLGNLSVTLGFNQSYFLYVAILDIGPFAEHSHQVANGLFLLVLAARGLLGASRLFRWKYPCKPSDVFYAALLPVASLLALGVFMTSPSPDLLVLVLGLVLTGQLLDFLTKPDDDPGLVDLLLVSFLAVAAVKVKLSIAGLAAATVGVATLVWLWRRRSNLKGSIAGISLVAVLSILVFLPWIIRSVILTGFPLYPSSFGSFNVDWLVQVDWESWTGVFFTPLPLGEIFSAPENFLRRLKSLGWDTLEVLLPLAIAAIATIFGLAVRGLALIRGYRPTAKHVSFIILIPALISFGFCMMFAPMARYFGATFWLLAAGALLLALGGTVYEEGRPFRRIPLVIVFVIVALVPMYYEKARIEPRAKFAGLPIVKEKQVKLATGLTVNIPEQGCGCYAAALPCTNSPNQALRLRRPGDLGSGFRIDTVIPWERHPDGDPRCQMGKPRK